MNEIACVRCGAGYGQRRNNGVLGHSLGWEVICFSLQHFISPALDLMPWLQTRDQEIAIRLYFFLMLASSILLITHFYMLFNDLIHTHIHTYIHSIIAIFSS